MLILQSLYQHKSHIHILNAKNKKNINHHIITIFGTTELSDIKNRQFETDDRKFRWRAKAGVDV